MALERLRELTKQSPRKRMFDILVTKMEELIKLQKETNDKLSSILVEISRLRETVGGKVE